VISIDGDLVHRVDLLHVPHSGHWTLEVAYSGTVAPAGKVTVQWGQAKFVGTVDPDHVGVSVNEVRVKIVGGFGWNSPLPAAWYQSDNPGLRGRTIATKAAEAVEETLYGATGQTLPPENVFRPLRVSYSRAKQQASAILRDTLATGQTYWIDFDGTTRAGVRVAPSSSARVVLIDYDAGSQWVDIDCDDPSNLIGRTIPADTTRGTPALVINELFAWTTEEGFRYRAAVAVAPIIGDSRLVEALRLLIRGMIPELPALELRRARVVAQANDGRVSVQQVDRAGDVSDFGRNEGAVRLYAGLAGASADLDTSQAPETVLAFARGDWSDPFAFLTPALGQPGHVPLVVRLEAANSIRMVGASNGIVYVGPTPTQPVALAPAITQYVDSVEQYLLLVDALVTAAAGGTPPLPIAARKAAATILDTTIEASRLEAT
jgi:hypothetical protein